MRPLVLAGLVLVALAAFVLIRGGTFTSRHDVLKIGDVKVSADEQKSIPPWVGGLGLVVGVGLIAAGARKRA